jgi:hypothetical protein
MSVIPVKWGFDKEDIKLVCGLIRLLWTKITCCRSTGQFVDDAIAISIGTYIARNRNAQSKRNAME